MSFSFDYVALPLLVLFVILFYVFKNKRLSPKSSPYLFFSQFSSISDTTWRPYLTSKIPLLHSVAYALLLLAFLDPHFLIPQTQKQVDQNENQIATEGIAIYLVLDQSGSMSKSAIPQSRFAEKKSKMSILRNLTKDFILEHPSDLIGLVSFARFPKVLSPLTLDHTQLLKTLSQLDVVKNDQEDGTGIGYAIYKTARILSATKHYAEEYKNEKPVPYTIKSAIMILVTDGFQDPNALDRGNRLRTIEPLEAAAYAASQGIRIYLISVDPSFSSSNFAPHRRQMEKIATLTGGAFYLVEDPEDLKALYQKIGTLEKGKIQQRLTSDQLMHSKEANQVISLYPYLIAAALLILLVIFVAETYIIKIIP